MPPQAVVIAGPNGAGKSTAAPDLLRDAVGIESFVNADTIALGLSGFRPEAAAFEAGRMMLHHLRELAHRRADFAFESTLSGRAALRFLRRLAADGYDTHIFYLWLPSPDLAVARVRRRVQHGGHDVPEPVIRRRFGKSIRNFEQLYRPLVTTWRLYDSSGLGGPAMIAHGTSGERPVILDGPAWDRVRTMIEEAQ